MATKKNFLDKFYDWAIRTGKKPRGKDKPSESLAPLGVKSKLGLLRRMLVDIGYIKATRIKGNGYEYQVWPAKGCKRIYGIKPSEFVRWIDNEFPTLKNRQDKQRKSAYVTAAWKFGEYLHWEMKDSNGKPLWKKEQLRDLKDRTHTPSIGKYEIEILPLEKSDSLIEFVKTRNITHYTMAYLSRWLGGMRYQEVINAPLDLNGATLKINFKTGKVTIWGKGRGGLQKERQPTLSPQVRKVLKEYLEHRKTVTPASEEDGKYLFLARHGKRWVENPGAFNESMRRHARAQGKLTKKEIKLITSHKIGRHGFGTFFYPRMPEKLLMQEMGLEDPTMLHRYSNISREQRAEIMINAINKDIAEEQPAAPDKLSVIKELFSGLTKKEKLSLLAEVL